MRGVAGGGEERKGESEWWDVQRSTGVGQEEEEMRGKCGHESLLCVFFFPLGKEQER